MTPPAPLALLARLAAVVDDWRHFGPTESNSDEITSVAAACDAACRASEGQGIDEKGTSNSEDAKARPVSRVPHCTASPSPAPIADDVVSAMPDDIETVRKALVTLNVEVGNDPYDVDAVVVATDTAEAALKRIAARTAQQDARIENQRGELAKLIKTREREVARLAQFEALAERAHKLHTGKVMLDPYLIGDLAELRREGA